MNKLSILVPVYNERDNLPRLVKEVEAAIAPSGRPFELVCVDDGSTDGSPDVLRKLCQEKSFVKAVFFRRNSGQSAAFDAGFAYATGDIIATMDADLQNDPRDILPMIGMIEGEGYDFVSGWRKDRKDGFVLRKIPSRIANYIIRRVTRTKLHDLGCSLKVYRKEVTDELRLYGEMHRFINVLVESVGAKTGEYIVHHRPRTAGVSKYGLSRTFKVMLDLVTVWFLQRYRTKPIYVFGGSGLSLVMLSGVICLVALAEKIVSGVFIHRNPLFIIAVMCAIVGFQFIALGLLAEMVIRTYFESQGKRSFIVRETIGIGGS